MPGPLVVWLALAFLALPLTGRSEAADPPLSPCTIRYPSDDRIEWECRPLKKGETLESVYGDRWVEVARFNRIDRRHARPGVPLKIPRVLEAISGFSPMPLHYSEAESVDRFVLIDLSEQFLGVYEYGALRFSLPVTTGERGNETPTGAFRITAAHRFHPSNLYTIEGTDTPYPMTHALRFFTSAAGVSYWIHGRDLPGKPASHGCIGLYDEVMQRQYYGMPRDPELQDAKRLFDWVLNGQPDEGKLIVLRDGPPVRIIGVAPRGISALGSPASYSLPSDGGCTSGH